ncbi:DUF3667 domain-containing protein [Ancylobacter sp.]|uniref:DUF3667 domain-containing protein n=1 Tax=Ancylobacter sp. TaxID=1872567 RepID=UPI003C7A6573
MTEPAARCANCHEPLGGRFCARCGEKLVGPADHTLRRFLEHLFEAFTHADGKVFLTLRCLLTRPGRLTADYLRGKRKPYIPPLQLFLIANLIFFLLHPLIGSKHADNRPQHPAALHLAPWPRRVPRHPAPGPALGDGRGLRRRLRPGGDHPGQVARHPRRAVLFPRRDGAPLAAAPTLLGAPGLFAALRRVLAAPDQRDAGP